MQVFWKKEEMEMVRYSSVHRETLQRKAVIGAEFASVLPVLQQCPHIFGDQVTHASFKHAYATVCSRAWGIEALQTLALVPFVDFFNHDAECQALLSYDEEKACAEVLYLPFLQCNIECLYFCHTMDFQIELHCFVHVDLMWNFYAKQTVYCSVRLLGLMLFVKD
jgi:hypothetical protein